MTALAFGKCQCFASEAYYIAQLGAATFMKVTLDAKHGGTVNGVSIYGRGRLVYKYTAGVNKFILIDRDELATAPQEITGPKLIFDPAGCGKGHVSIKTNGTFVESNGFKTNHHKHHNSHCIDVDGRAREFTVEVIDTTLEDPIDLCPLDANKARYEADPTIVCNTLDPHSLCDTEGYEMGQYPGCIGNADCYAYFDQFKADPALCSPA